MDGDVLRFPLIRKGLADRRKEREIAHLILGRIFVLCRMPTPTRNANMEAF